MSRHFLLGLIGGIRGIICTRPIWNVVLEQNITSGLPNNLQELITGIDPSVVPCELGTIFVMK